MPYLVAGWPLWDIDGTAPAHNYRIVYPVTASVTACEVTLCNTQCTPAFANVTYQTSVNGTDWYDSPAVWPIYQSTDAECGPIAPTYPDFDSARRHRNEELVRQAEARHKELREAEDRAKKLLFRFCTPEQRKMYEEREYLIVRTRSRTWRIRKGRVANVDIIDANRRVVRTLCAHPTPFVPDSDNVLAQKLHIEHDEDGFYRIANPHPPYMPQEVVEL